MRWKHIIFRSLLIVVGLAVVTVAAVVFAVDTFRVKGGSMEPTYHSGRRIFVNKLLMGARIYKEYDFSRSALSSFRMPGFRKLAVGDVAVFNYPYAGGKDTIGFTINYVYAKRCLGVPGDSIRIADGFYRGTDGCVLGVMEIQNRLHSTPDSVLARVKGRYYAMDYPESGWTIKNLGPVYIPGKGDKVAIDCRNLHWYRKLVKYETGLMPESDSTGRVFLGGKPLDEYEFRTDWYFFGGDNVLDSRDSRYFGLVPEEYIVGIVACKSGRFIDKIVSWIRNSLSS